MKFNMKSLLTASVVLFVCLSQAFANWPDWRGPTGDGRSDATDLPLNWSETKNIVWKTPIHDRHIRRSTRSATSLSAPSEPARARAENVHNVSTRAKSGDGCDSTATSRVGRRRGPIDVS